MNDFGGDRPQSTGPNGVDTVRRRHVIYASGYDPRGAQGYFDLFRRTCERTRQLWPISLKLEPPNNVTDEAAQWHLEVRGANWQVNTRYDFLRMESFFASTMARPAPRQVLSALHWFLGDVVSGAQFLIFRASWRFALHLLCFQLMALAWVSVAALVGIVVGLALTRHLGAPWPFSVVAGLAAAYLALIALRPLAKRWRLFQIVSSWATQRRFGRGQPTWIDDVVDAAARRLLAAARTDDADELAVVGHSSGGVVACAIVARALELDPDLGKDGPRLVLLTLGSVMPAVALHPAAHKMRAIVSRLATAHNLAWIDCQASKDVMCFADFDPVAGVGVQVGQERCNPLRWPISFKDMIAPENYARFRRNFFRMHYQYILPGDRPAPYDYVLLVGGPTPIAAWPRRERELMTGFLQNCATADEHVRHQVAVGTAP
jgi:hypothetical protein